MRASRAMMIASACALPSCSLITTWDGLRSSDTGGASSTTGSSSTRATSTTSTNTTHSSTTATQSSSTGMQCSPGGYYCGGDKVTGNTDTLYQCNADGSGTTIQVCIYGCVVRSAKDDICHCQPGAAYCGGDKLDGDTNTLYRCNAGSAPPTVIMTCPNGCKIIPNANDACN